MSLHDDNLGVKLFYPFEAFWHGYIVSNKEQESAVIADILRYRQLNKRMTGAVFFFVFIPCTVVTNLLFMSRPFAALAILLLPIVAAISGILLLRYWCFRNLLKNTKRTVRDTDAIIRGRSFAKIFFSTLTLCTVGIVVIAFLTLRIYDERINVLPINSGTIEYFAGISVPLCLSLMCLFIFVSFLLVAISFGLTVGWDKLFARSHFMWAALSLVFCGIIGLSFANLAAGSFLHPTAKVTITPDALYCDEQVMSWSNVADLEVETGRYGTKYAAIFFANKPPAPNNYILLSKPTRVRRCEITELNVDYNSVYRSMVLAWQAARTCVMGPGWPPDCIRK
jgi:hypothetical protein